MYEVIIKEYLKRLSLKDIDDFANKNGIYLKPGENKILYEVLINDWRILYKGDPTNLFNDLKNKLSSDTYNKAIEVYKYFKDKIK